MHLARIKLDVAFAAVSQDKKEMARVVAESAKKYEELKKDFDALSDENIAVNERLIDVRQKLSQRDHQLCVTQDELDEMKRREFNRLNRLDDKACQHIPDPFSIQEAGVQTDFMTAPVR
jgi:septal ring factor EnvC (AmiA/AmiB activator)